MALSVLIRFTALDLPLWYLQITCKQQSLPS